MRQPGTKGGAGVRDSVRGIAGNEKGAHGVLAQRRLQPYD